MILGNEVQHLEALQRVVTLVDGTCNILSSEVNIGFLAVLVVDSSTLLLSEVSVGSGDRSALLSVVNEVVVVEREETGSLNTIVVEVGLEDQRAELTLHENVQSVHESLDSVNLFRETLQFFCEVVNSEVETRNLSLKSCIDGIDLSLESLLSSLDGSFEIAISSLTSSFLSGDSSLTSCFLSLNGSGSSVGRTLSSVGSSLSILGSLGSSVSSFLSLLSGSLSSLITSLTCSSFIVDELLQIGNNLVESEVVDTLGKLIEVTTEVTNGLAEVVIKLLQLVVEIEVGDSLLQLIFRDISAFNSLQTSVDVVDLLFPLLDGVDLLLQVFYGSLTSGNLVIKTLLESTELSGSFNHMVGDLLVNCSNLGIDILHCLVEILNAHLTVSQVFQFLDSLFCGTDLSLESTLGSCCTSDFLGKIFSGGICGALSLLDKNCNFSVLGLKLLLQASDLSLEVGLHLIDRRSKRVDLSLQVLDFIIVVLTRRQVC